MGWPVVRQMSKLHCVSLRHRILDLDDVLVIAAVWHIVSRALEARASENRAYQSDDDYEATHVESCQPEKDMRLNSKVREVYFILLTWFSIRSRCMGAKK
jgi:hypothetical protein